MNENAKVLIVDDDATNRRVLSEIVKLDGHEPWLAEGGAEALAMIESESFDIVILDLMMPDISGLDVLDRLAELGVTPSLPVVVVSGLDETEVRVDALERGAADFVTKPFDRHELCARLRNLVLLKQSRDELARRGDALETLAHRHEADLRLLDRRVRSATELLPLLLFDVDFGEDIPVAKWLVGSLATTLGLAEQSPEEWYARVHEDDRPRLERLWEELRNGEVSQWQTRFRIRSPGADKDVSVAVAGKTLARQRRVVGALFDVSESRVLEEALLQSQKMEAVGNLAGGVAHDFNNLLTAIISFAEFVRVELDEEDPRRADLDEVLRAAERAADLTRQLLAFSRQSAQTKLSFDLNQRVLEAGKLLRRTVGQGIEVSVATSAQPVIVHMDPVQLDQVLLNLCVNARDAMPEGGNLHIVVREPSDSRMVRVDVSDSGAGMEEATLRHAFEPFFTTKNAGEGTGLGLSICLSIVQESDGKISVDSEVGVGTTVHLDLPMSDEPVEEEDAEVPVDLRGNGELVLVAEDEAALRAIAQRALEANNYRVLLARDGAEAERALEAWGGQVDLVFTDVVMPRRGGGGVVEATRKHCPAAAILVTSGYVDEAGSLGRTLVEDGPILWKPYTPKMLLQAVRRGLDRRDRGETRSRRISVAPSESPSTAVLSGGLGGESTAAEFIPTEALVLGHRAHTSGRIHDALSAMGHTVATADSTNEVLDRLAAQGYLLFAFAADEIDGTITHLLQEVRGLHPNLPVLVTAAAPTADLVRAVGRYGAIEYLPQPFSDADVVRAADIAVKAARVALLQSKLLAARAGADLYLGDLDATEAAFSEALGTLRMAYQPIVRSRDHSIYGYEALLRCDVPLLSNPMAVLTAAEVLGRVMELGSVIRGRVRDDIGDLEDGIAMFVNLHPMELREKYLASEEEPLLSSSRRIVLEVTERASLSGGPQLLQEVRRLRGHGYRIAVDDLGEGYAGLSSLAQLTPDIVKIDRSLVDRIDSSPLKEDIVASIVLMSRKSGITVVAEGIETAAEKDVLTMLGCDLLQGYYFARPGPPFPSISYGSADA